MKRLLATAALALSLTTSANAANIWTEQDGCDPKGCTAIHIQGHIDLEDFKTFHNAVIAANIKTAVVYLDSDGGNVIGGLLTGLEINERGFFTYVADKTNCVSVCASMWLAGKQRFISTTANVGFHQPYLKDKRGRYYSSPEAVAMVKNYYAKIGIPKPAADFMVSADPRDVYWLNGDLAKGFGIDFTEWNQKKEAPAEQVTPQQKTVTLPKAFIDGLKN